MRGAYACHPCAGAHWLGTWHAMSLSPAPCPSLLEEPLVQGCEALSATSLSWVRTWGHLHCPCLQVYLAAAPSSDGAGLHGAMVSTCPWAADCAVPGLAEPAALPLCHLRNSTVLFSCWNFSYRSLEETHCFD